MYFSLFIRNSAIKEQLDINSKIMIASNLLNFARLNFTVVYLEKRLLSLIDKSISANVPIQTLGIFCGIEIFICDSLIYKYNNWNNFDIEEKLLEIISSFPHHENLCLGAAHSLEFAWLLARFNSLKINYSFGEAEALFPKNLLLINPLMLPLNFIRYC